MVGEGIEKDSETRVFFKRDKMRKKSNQVENRKWQKKKIQKKKKSKFSLKLLLERGLLSRYQFNNAIS